MPISLKNMKGCASPASTAICSSTIDPRSMIRHSTSGTPRHRRLNSYLHDQYNHLIPTNAAPCIAELPITPRFLYRKGSSLKKHFSDAIVAGDVTRRRSAADIREYLSRRRNSAEIRRSPPGSSRYLLLDTATFREDLPLALVTSEQVEEVRKVGPTDCQEKYGYGVVGKRGGLVRSTPVYRQDSDKSRALVPCETHHKHRYQGSNCAAAATADRDSNRRLGLTERAIVKSSSSPSPAPSAHQVVVLRVSLHCKGCEGKLRKHLSKMEGVTSFSIDLETKRVTVTGTLSPLDVLTSISKVKNAQFWPSPSTSASSFSSSFSSALSRSEINSV